MSAPWPTETVKYVTVMWTEQLHKYLLFDVPTSDVHCHYGRCFAHKTEKTMPLTEQRKS